jgi:hypothetical protein
MGIPLPALSMQPPPNPLDEYAKALSVKSMIGQQETQKLQQAALSQENQQRQNALDDATGMKKALIDANGDYDKYRANVRDPKYGISVQGQLASDNQVMAHQKASYELDDTKLAAQQKKATALAGHLQPLTELPDWESVQAALPKVINTAISDGTVTQQEVADLSHLKSIDDLKMHVSGLQMIGEQIKQAQDNRKAGMEAWKEQPGTGTMINVDKTSPDFGTTMAISNGVPIPADLAKTLGIPELANKTTTPQMLKVYKEAADQGNHIENVDGKQQLYDFNGNKLKVLGAAPSIALLGAQQAAVGGPAGAAMVDLVGQNRVDLAGVLSRMPPAAKADFLATLAAKYPDFNQGQFGIEKKVGEQFTSGTYSQQLNAINTAREHMNTFKTLATALDNSDVQALNKVKNVWKEQFGSDAPTNFILARDAFAGEVGKALAGAGVTQGDRNKVDESIKASESPKQLLGAANTADSLLAGKQKALKATYEQGRQGKPNFGEENKTGTAFSVTAPNGKVYNFPDQASADRFKAAAGIK